MSSLLLNTVTMLCSWKSPLDNILYYYYLQPTVENYCSYSRHIMIISKILKCLKILTFLLVMAKFWGTCPMSIILCSIFFWQLLANFYEILHGTYENQKTISYCKWEVLVILVMKLTYLSNFYFLGRICWKKISVTVKRSGRKKVWNLESKPKSRST